jgi:transcriptional regulator with XRE-family HTH domain
MTDNTLTHYRQIIARRLRTARVVRGISCATLANRAGVQPDHLASFERGRSSPSVDELERLAAALRFPRAHFMESCMLCGSHD